MQGVGNFASFLPLNWLPWQRPLRNQKTGHDHENSRKYLPFGKKIVKIGPVDSEIALHKLKKEEINASKTYSPSGKFAERAKLEMPGKT